MIYCVNRDCPYRHVCSIYTQYIGGFEIGRGIQEITHYNPKTCEHAKQFAEAPTPYSPIESNFLGAFKALSSDVNQTARDKGWWEGERNDGELIALMHSELSEALEALRHGNPPDDHIGNFSGVEDELADVIIRIMDYAAERNLDVGKAVIEKARYNKGRAYKHGGKEF